MANLPTLVPTSYSSQTGTTWTTTTVGNIDNTVALADGNFIVSGVNSTSTIFYAFTDMLLDFESMTTLTYNIRYQTTDITNDTETLYLQVLKSDKIGTLTDLMQVVSTTSNISLTNSGDISFTGVFTSGAGTDWDNAYLAISTDHITRGQPDNSWWLIDEVELNGTYKVASEGDGKFLMFF